MQPTLLPPRFATRLNPTVSPLAIGYVSMANVTSAVKALKLNGVSATPDAAQKGVYPLTRALFMVADSAASADVRAFLDFVLSASGQAVVGRMEGRVR